MDFRYHDVVDIRVGHTWLQGELTIPLKAHSIVVFAHGSGSSRHSPRNKMVAHYLNEKNIGTLLFDLLSAEEDMHYYNRFNIDLLSQRLMAATEWLQRMPAAKDCSIGFFGASTGSAAALTAAAHLPQTGAVVSRGGRPDLAADILHKVKAPTLLIVGSLDYDVIRLNQQAFNLLKGEKHLEIIEGATHLFEEQGTMEQVCERAGAWFQKYLEPIAID